MHIFSATAILLLFVFACSVQEDDSSLVPDEEVISSVFSYEVDEMTAATRSQYIASNFNDSKITSVTLVAYETGESVSGKLQDRKYFTSGFTGMPLSLVRGASYNIYALVNMGDQRSNVRDNEGEFLRDFCYKVPGFADVNSRGIPMGGSITGYTAGSSASGAIPLKRLFAKVTLNVTAGFNGGTASGVKITRLSLGNCNGLLRPFGVNAVEGNGQAISVSDYLSVSGGGSSSASVVFYVPENRKGRIGSQTASREKNPDLNPAISSEEDFLTYVEASVTANSVYYNGTAAYRSYIGTNNYNNFDVIGNCAYVWTLTLDENGLVNNDWKLDNNITDGRHLEFIRDPIYVEPGESIVKSEFLYTNIASGDISHSFFSSIPGTFHTVTGSSIDISSSAVNGQTIEWSAKATANPCGSAGGKTAEWQVEDLTHIHVLNRNLSFDKDLYEVLPRKSVVSAVTYGFSGQDPERGLGAAPGTKGVKWDITPPSELSHTNVVSTNRLDYSYNSLTDEIVWSPTKYAVPGDYTIVCQTNDGKHSDDAVLRVVDTRWINTEMAYSGYTREKFIQKSAVTSSTRWDIGYAFGDLSNDDSNNYVLDSPNTFYYMGRYIGLDWQNYIGYGLVGNASDYLVNTGNLHNFVQHFSISPNIPIGDYRFEIYWKDTWDEILQDYRIKDYAILHVTGTNVSSISVPATVVWVGETSRMTAGVLPSNASDKSVIWSVASGSDKVSIDASTGFVTGLRSGNATVRAAATDGSGVYGDGNVEVRQHVTSVELDRNSIVIAKTLGESLTVTVGPADAYDKSVVWNSDNTKVATVDHNGKISAVGIGTATITCSSNDVPSIKDECMVTVTAAPLSSISIDGNAERNLLIGDDSPALELAATLRYADGGTSPAVGVIWISSNPSVASVSSAGVVTGHSTGTASITARVTVGGNTFTSSAVAIKVNSLAISPVSFSVNAGSDKAYSAVVTTSDGNNVAVTAQGRWTSSNTGVATVSSNVVTGVAEGNTNISFAYEGTYGEAVRTASLTVNDGIKSYGIPVVTLKYPNSPVAYGSISSLNPLLAVKQDAVHLSGRIETLTLAVGQYTAAYTAVPVVGLELDSETGVVTTSSNEGAVVAARTEYSIPEVTLFSYADIACSGGSSTPSIAYSQTKTVYSAGRRQTEPRIINVTASVTANGKTGMSSAVPVTQNGDNGLAVTAVSSAADVSGASISFSTVTDNAGATLNTLNGTVIWAENKSERRFEKERITVVCNGISATKDAVSYQDAGVVSYGYRLSITPSPSVLAVGCVRTYTVRRYADVYVNGVISVVDKVGTVISNNLCDWTVQSGNTRVVLSGDGKVKGMSAGSAVVKAAIKTDSSVCATATLDVVSGGVNVDAGWEDDGTPLEL